MPLDGTQTTDQELLQKIQTSHIEERQKKALEPLIATMDPAEKQKLISLIDAANSAAEADPAYQDGLKKLNAEYKQKMEKVTDDSMAQVRQDYENADKAASGEEIAALETEMQNVQTVAEAAPAAPVKTAKKSSGMKFIAILIGLVVLAGLIFALVTSL